eukprot:s299_g23.t1
MEDPVEGRAIFEAAHCVGKGSFFNQITERPVAENVCAPSRRNAAPQQGSVRFDGLALQYASPSLRQDREIVLQAVRQHGCALEFACEELRSDRDVVWQAVNKTPRSLNLALGGLADDAELEDLARDVRCRIQETGK